MKARTKKVLKIIGLLIGIIVIAIAGFAAYNWDSISIMISNAEIIEEVAAIPEPAAENPEPITYGETDWTCWRGPDGDAKSKMTGILTDWSKGLTKNWEINYLCRGPSSATWSAPSIQGNRLVITGRDENEDYVFCLNPEDGSLIWKQSYKAAAVPSYGMGARATPWIDGEKVYTFGRSGDLVCWDLFNGNKIWHGNVTADGGEEHTWGHSSSPFVTDSLVIVNGGGAARTIAYNKFTGDIKWTSGTGLPGYAAITSMMIEDTQVLLSFHGAGLSAINPDNGDELWFHPWKTSYDVNATTPIAYDDKVFITSGYGTGGALLKVSLSGADVLWTNDVMASHHSDPFIIDGYIYGYSGDSMQNKGDFICVDLNTGEEQWSTGDMGWGTSVRVEDYILCGDIKGNLYLMKPDPSEFKLITEFPDALGDISGAAWTIPVLANGKLYLRFKQRLISYEIKAAQNEVAGI